MFLTQTHQTTFILSNNYFLIFILDIPFQSETGPGLIPLKCYIRRCAPKVEVMNIDFGKVTIGQKVIKPLKITNSQILSSKFTITRVINTSSSSLMEDSVLSDENDKDSLDSFIPVITTDNTDIVGVKNGVLENTNTTTNINDIIKSTNNLTLEAGGNSNKNVKNNVNENMNPTNQNLTLRSQLTTTADGSIIKDNLITKLLKASSSVRVDPAMNEIQLITRVYRIMTADIRSKKDQFPFPLSLNAIETTGGGENLNDTINGVHFTRMKKAKEDKMIQLNKKNGNKMNTGEVDGNVDNENENNEGKGNEEEGEDGEDDVDDDDDEEEDLGNVGFINGYSSITLDALCSPLTSGIIECQMAIIFDNIEENNDKYIDKQGRLIYREQLVTLRANVEELPIYPIEEVIDFKCTLFQRIYRKKLELCNRSTTACKVTIKIAPLFEKYIEVNPNIVFVQGDSIQAINLKFSPNLSMLKTLAYFTLPYEEYENAALLQFPIEIQVRKIYHYPIVAYCICLLYFTNHSF